MGFKRWADARWMLAYRNNQKYILRRALEIAGPGGRIVDIGCSGEQGLVFGDREVIGLDISPEALRVSNVPYKVAGDASSVPFRDSSIRVMVANQLIEHLTAIDEYFEEVRRALSVGGVLILSTENASSPLNVVPLLFGWMPFSLTNITPRAGLGNPLAMHRGETIPAPMCHIRLYTVYALRELAARHGFEVTEKKAFGWPPFVAGAVPPRYGHFITLLLRKMPDDDGNA